MTSGGVEKAAVAGVVGRILRERADDIMDMGKAVSRVERSNAQARNEEKVQQYKAGKRDFGGKAKGGKGKGPGKAPPKGKSPGARGGPRKVSTKGVRSRK